MGIHGAKFARNIKRLRPRQTSHLTSARSNLSQGIKNTRAHQQVHKGLRAASGESDVALTSLTKDYHGEREHSKHRAGFFDKFMGDLQVYYNAHVRPTSQESFDCWVENLSVFEVRRILKDRLKHDPPHEQAQLAAAFVNGVRYLSNEGRQSFVVSVVAGRLQTADRQWLSTASMETYFSGVGWAIWVMGPDGVLYTASHKLGTFHHSSFLSGNAIRGAGEWKVTDGRVEYVTSKTGHYKCDMAAFVNALNKMSAMGLDMRHSTAVVFEQSGKPVGLSVDQLIRYPNATEEYLSFGDRTYLPKENRKPKMSGSLGGHRQGAPPSNATAAGTPRPSPPSEYSTPIPGARATNGPGEYSTPIPGARATNGPGEYSTPIPGARATNGPGEYSTPIPGARATNGPNEYSTPIPGARAANGPGGNQYGKTPANQYGKVMVGQQQLTIIPDATSG